MDGTTTIKIDYYEELKAKSDRFDEKETPYKIKDCKFDMMLNKNGYCKCGYEVKESHKYCSNCGRKLSWTES